MDDWNFLTLPLSIRGRTWNFYKKNAKTKKKRISWTFTSKFQQIWAQKDSGFVPKTGHSIKTRRDETIRWTLTRIPAKRKMQPLLVNQFRVSNCGFRRWSVLLLCSNFLGWVSLPLEMLMLSLSFWFAIFLVGPHTLWTASASLISHLSLYFYFSHIFGR